MFSTSVRHGLQKYNKLLWAVTKGDVVIDGMTANLLYEALGLPQDQRPEDIDPEAANPRDAMAVLPINLKCLNRSRPCDGRGVVSNVADKQH